ncbi:dTDP-4-dehydrorhamnose reductase [Acidisarcina polymorpha]|uniref:dTDP-4-dehydrorhamnose reductase n=1 Tax=Acidisarcina polymorpha TaxID=2211140 RepID=A0A2Z5G2S5_9BACT|nr:dTDP-4-dehydrorhamnose reductase [Acidisarcina polymorpha]AXC12935.1 dTDP-4-dehydrorhamnose reductase [Acidisarcina polymorpha]
MNGAGKERRVLLLGANGQLGSEFRTLLQDKCELHALTRAEADLSKPEQLRKIVADLEPSIILNAAAYTAVDKAESEPELAELVNTKTPAVLAAEAARYGGLLVHYSTDYVFDGSKASPWIEEDATGPLNVYGKTKLAGEQVIASQGGAYLIFRTSWVFAPHGKNFLLTILRLARERDRLTIVADQKGAPTSALAIARATAQVLDRVSGPEGTNSRSPDWSGIYHLTCAGETTWHGFAEAIVEEAADLLDGRRPEVAPIPSSQFPTPARRPANSVLDNGKLRHQFGVALPHWRQALVEAMAGLRFGQEVARP